MNLAFQLTLQATEDLDAIWWSIAADNRDAAERVEMEIIAVTDSTPAPLPEFWPYAPDIEETPPPVPALACGPWQEPPYRCDATGPPKSSGRFAASQILSSRAWSGLVCRCESRSVSSED